MIILAIDPGTTASGYVVYDADRRVVVECGNLSDEVLLARARSARWPCPIDRFVCEDFVVNRNRPMGQESIEAIRFSGRFHEAVGKDVAFQPRQQVCLWLMGAPSGKDSDVRQAIIDAFGGKRKAIGLKSCPGPLYLVKKDAWLALAHALTYDARRKQEVQPCLRTTSQAPTKSP